MKERWQPFMVRLNHEELEVIIMALAETKRLPKLRKELETASKDMYHYLP